MSDPKGKVNHYKMGNMAEFNKTFGKFQKNVLGKEKFVLLAYANWCGHCNTMKPTFHEAIKALGGQNGGRSTARAKTNTGARAATTRYNIVEIEHDVTAHLMEHHKEHLFTQLLSGVRGYPTLMSVSKIDKNNMHTNEFDGERTAGQFTKFIKDAHARGN